MTNVELAVESQARLAKIASRELASMKPGQRVRGLQMMASELLANQGEILQANGLDIKESLHAGLPQPLVKRLLLTPEKISTMARGLLEVGDLPEVVGEVIETLKRPNGLVIRKVRVQKLHARGPMGIRELTTYKYLIDGTGQVRD